MNFREDMNIVIVGHVDHGKSTIIGRLLADTNSLPDGKLEQVREMCRRNAKPFEYAFLLDALKDERDQGITIDSARAFFKTKKRDYIIIDAPGHIEFLKNMVTGAARAEAALLVIDANEGIKENSKRHGYLLSMLGIKQICILVNKMDLVSYDEKRFNQIEKDYRGFLDSIGVEPQAFIPVSGMEGDNIAAHQENMPWYDGDTVLDMLDKFQALKQKDNLPFRMPVQAVYKFTRDGDDRRIVAGTIDTGKVSVGEEVVFYPSGKKSKVKTIEAFNAPVQETADYSSATGFTLEEQIYIKRGDLACKVGEKKPRVTTRFKANIFWLGKSSLVKNKKYLLKIGTAKVGLEVEEIIRVLDASSLDANVKGEVERHDVAEVIFRADKAIAFDLATDIDITSRFVIVDQFEIAGGGIITESLSDDVSWARDKVQLRIEKWYSGYVSAVQRAERYNQRPTLILVTGKKETDRKEYAARLERRLFKDGKFVYYMSLGNFVYGVGGDIIAEEKGHNEEHFRRLAEFSNIMLATGQILIVSAQDVSEKELSIIKTSIDEDMITSVWVGEGLPEEYSYDMIYPEADARAFSIKAKEYLQKKGIIFSYNFDKI